MEVIGEEDRKTEMKDSISWRSSGAETNWTDKIEDRFKNPIDDEFATLATTVPQWSNRVEERLKATLRPKDGVPAAHLKSWLEGAG
jgi:hypothetical protein